MQYVVLLGENASDISSQVNRLLKLGWRPLGGVSVSSSYDDEQEADVEQWAQAMVRDGEFPEPELPTGETAQITSEEGTHQSQSA